MGLNVQQCFLYFISRSILPIPLVDETDTENLNKTLSYFINSNGIYLKLLLTKCGMIGSMCLVTAAVFGIGLIIVYILTLKCKCCGAIEKDENLDRNLKNNSLNSDNNTNLYIIDMKAEVLNINEKKAKVLNINDMKNFVSKDQNKY